WSTSNRISLRRSRRTSTAALRGPVTFPLPASWTSRSRYDRSQLRNRWVEERSYLDRSEEHTSELQSHLNLVCRLLLEKKKKEKFTVYLFKKKYAAYHVLS